jgi:hypothetical protein
MYKKHLYLLPAAFAISMSVPIGGTVPAIADDVTVSNSIELDSREQELRRKEQELLQALEVKSDQAATTEHIPQAESPAPANLREDAEAIRILEVRAPESKPAFEKALDVAPKNELRQDSTPQEMTQQSHSNQSEALKELQHHPALEPPRKAKTVPMVPSNRVRTKTFEEFPDGTTAKRVGSFYRIDRAGADSQSVNGAERARTVPLQDIVPANSTRPAMLTSEELATIRSTSTYLKTGPTRLDSALLKVPQYSEVTIDHRSGTWYRVKTANGVRGWVPGSALLFDDGMNPRSTVRISGVQNPLP